MSKLITISIVTPEDVIFKGEAVSVIIPAADGYMEFLQHHSPLVTPLGTGVLTLTKVNGQRRYFYLSGGYAEIHDNKLTVLADEAQRDVSQPGLKPASFPLVFSEPEDKTTPGVPKKLDADAGKWEI